MIHLGVLVMVGLMTISLSISASDRADITSQQSPGNRSITAYDRAVSSAKIGGYMDTELFIGDETTTFKAHRLILQASSHIHERLFFNTEIEFEYGGQINSGSDQGELKIEQAWLDLLLVDDHYLRTGIIVMPFGRVNVLHDSDVRDATNRPIYAKYIVPSTWMDTGIGVHGEIETQRDWIINYEGYLVNGLGSTGTNAQAPSDKSGIRYLRPSFKSDNNNVPAFIGRVSVSPSQVLELATSGYIGSHTGNTNDNITMIGFDALYKKGPFEGITEYATIAIENNGSGPDAMMGYYIEGRYHFMPEFIRNSFLATGFSNPTMTAFARYSVVDTDTSKTTQYDRTQTTLGVNYRPVENVVFKLEYEINGEAENETSNNTTIMSVAVGF